MKNFKIKIQELKKFHKVKKTQFSRLEMIKTLKFSIAKGPYMYEVMHKEGMTCFLGYTRVCEYQFEVRIGYWGQIHTLYRPTLYFSIGINRLACIYMVKP